MPNLFFPRTIAWWLPLLASALLVGAPALRAQTWIGSDGASPVSTAISPNVTGQGAISQGLVGTSPLTVNVLPGASVNFAPVDAGIITGAGPGNFAIYNSGYLFANPINSTTADGIRVFDPNSSAAVYNFGTIDASGRDASAINIANGVAVNQGFLIANGGTGTAGIEFVGPLPSVGYNGGTILSNNGGNGIYAHNSGPVSIHNDRQGVIYGLGDEIYTVWVRGPGVAYVRNDGAIHADGFDHSIGVAYSDGRIGTVDNYGLITALGDQGTGISFGNPGLAGQFGITNNGRVNNFGTILANGSTDGAVVFRGLGGSVYNEGGRIESQLGSGIFTNNAQGSYLVSNYNGSIIGGAGKESIRLGGFNNQVTLGNWSVLGGAIRGGDSAAGGNVLTLKLSGVNASAASLLQAQAAAATLAPGTAAAPNFLTYQGQAYSLYNFSAVQVLTSSYAQQAQTSNQAAVGATLDGFTAIPSADMRAVLTALDASGAAPAGLDALSPGVYASFATIAFDDQTRQSDFIDERIASRWLSDSAVDSVTLLDPSMNPTMASASQRLAARDNIRDPKAMADPKDMKAMTPPPAPTRDWSFFASGQGVITDQNNTADRNGAERQTASATAGFDYRITPELIVGAQAGYSSTDMDLSANGSTADLQTVFVGPFASYRAGAFFTNAQFTYGFNHYDLDRTISFPGLNRKATGNADGDQYAGGVTAGYDFALAKGVLFTPIAGVQYGSFSMDGFSESGAGAASLSLGSQGAESVRTKLGFRAAFDFRPASWLQIQPSLRAFWVHEFLDDSRALTSTFNEPNSAPFTIGTGKPERDTALVGAGIDGLIFENGSSRGNWFLDYSAQIRSESVSSTISGGLRFTFR